jgi:heavy metal efflux system protein
LYVKQKQGLLKFSDSLYSAFYERAALRFEKGESNLLEKTAAETQLGQIRNQLQQLSQDSAVLSLQFQLLLNSPTRFIPSQGSFKMDIPPLMDTSTLKNHPTLNLILQQQKMADASIRLEKSKLLPDLSFGYSNTSLQGVGADEKYYSSSKRFSSVQAGLGIPIFARAQKAKISGAKFSKTIAENSYALGWQSLQGEYEQALNNYKKYRQTVTYFETTALKNANLITTTANQQLANGSINYLEWVLLMNQATTVKNDYIESVKNLNQSTIQLNYFNNK